MTTKDSGDSWVEDCYDNGVNSQDINTLIIKSKQNKVLKMNKSVYSFTKRGKDLLLL